MRFHAVITDFGSRHYDAIRQIRDEVFVVEQKVDRQEEFDDRDKLCTHVVVLAGETGIATGRIDLDKGGKIGRVAVLKEFRRQGVGSLVMQTLERVAVESGAVRLWFHAQLQAVSFYESLGYKRYGEEFVEAEIPHVCMEKLVPPRTGQK